MKWLQAHWCRNCFNVYYGMMALCQLVFSVFCCQLPAADGIVIRFYMIYALQEINRQSGNLASGGLY